MYLIFNLKQNKDLNDNEHYLKSICDFLDKFPPGDTKLIIAPSTPYLSLYKKYLDKYSYVGVSAQDVSKFNGGAFTGESSAFQIKDYAKYCIVGHSERRSNFGESAKDITLKINNCLENDIKPIVCFSNMDQLTTIPNLKDVLLAYEPIEYIGGSEAINGDKLKEFHDSTGISQQIIYGGSVNQENILRFVGLSFLSGLLVGGASLDTNKAKKILNLVASL